VHQVQVEVFYTEIVESVLKGKLNVFRVMVQLKQLGGDEDLLTRDTGIPNALSNFGFISVCPSAAYLSTTILGLRGDRTIGVCHQLTTPRSMGGIPS